MGTSLSCKRLVWEDSMCVHVCMCICMFLFCAYVDYAVCVFECSYTCVCEGKRASTHTEY